MNIVIGQLKTGNKLFGQMKLGKINRFGSDGKQYTYVKKGARLQKHNINRTRKNCGGRLMV